MCTAHYLNEPLNIDRATQPSSNNFRIFHTVIIPMAFRKIAVTPLLMHWSYHNHALRHQNITITHQSQYVMLT